MRRQERARRSEDRVLRARRLVGQHIERRTTEVAGRECVSQCTLIYDRPASCVHEQRTGLHQSDLAMPNQPACGRRERNLQVDDVRAAKQVVQLWQQRSPLRRLVQSRVDDEDLAPKRQQPPDDGMPDATETYHPDGRFAEHEQPSYTPPSIPVVPREVVGDSQTAGRGEDQGHGVIGDLVHRGAGQVHNLDTVLPRRLDVDRVQPRTELADHSDGRSERGDVFAPELLVVDDDGLGALSCSSHPTGVREVRESQIDRVLDRDLSKDLSSDGVVPRYHLEAAVLGTRRRLTAHSVPSAVTASYREPPSRTISSSRSSASTFASHVESSSPRQSGSKNVRPSMSASAMSPGRTSTPPISTETSVSTITLRPGIRDVGQPVLLLLQGPSGKR